MTRRLVVDEPPGGVERVDDGEAQPSARCEYARGLGDGGRHVVDVLQRHESDREVGDSVRQREAGGVSQVDLDRPIRLARVRDHRARRVDTDDVVSASLQVARQPALAAPDVDGEPPGRRHDLQELVAMEAPVAVVHRRSRPRREARRGPLPGL
jgi:hypothetical protein